MRILETYCVGKVSDEANEDRIALGDGYAAVIDGATDKSGYRVEGRTGGSLVADVLKRMVEDGDVLVPAMPFPEFVRLATERVAAALDAAGWPKDLPPPCASLVVYSAWRREVWRVGDCHFSVRGEASMGSKAIDELTSSMRAAVIRLAEGGGRDMSGRDPGREVIMPLLQAQGLHANNADSPVGYAVIDGRSVPASLLERPVEVSEGEEVLLASDGFDFLGPTLAETQAAQERSYRLDPMRIGLPGGRASTKGIVPGAVRHDDQTYVKLVA